MTIVPTPYLTVGYSPEIAEQIRQSHPGMAHFARTGPINTVCDGCIFHNDLFVGGPNKARRRRHPGCLPRSAPTKPDTPTVLDFVCSIQT